MSSFVLAWSCCCFESVLPPPVSQPGMSACSPQMRPVTQHTIALSHGSQPALPNTGPSDHPKLTDPFSHSHPFIHPLIPQLLCPVSWSSIKLEPHPLPCTFLFTSSPPLLQLLLPSVAFTTLPNSSASYLDSHRSYCLTTHFLGCSFTNICTSAVCPAILFTVPLKQLFSRNTFRHWYTGTPPPPPPLTPPPPLLAQD